ncbi:MAG: ABC transporter permease [Synechococcaceae cyanobacterium SM2_3_1]|nr:ABC transporter permease [Synechococcaceae cyanobacterium SM2_3_1]
MQIPELIAVLATAIATSTPLIFACIGETLTERSGVINLSAEGTMLLAAMTGFALANTSGNLILGFVGAGGVGAGIALLMAVGSISLKQSQIALGFVLTLLCSDLSSFLGTPFVRIPGPTVPRLPVPGLASIPVLGPLFFQSDGLVYLSYVLVVGSYWFLYHTRPGLELRALGERPAAAFARGIAVTRLRYLYTLLGGFLIGIAGAAFSLDFKAGWSHRHTAGYGWIALAIVIFGGWHPLRVALGAYLFGILQSLASLAQGSIPGIPTQVFSVAPFVLMILVLAVTANPAVETLLQRLPAPFQRMSQHWLRSRAPTGLGQPFEQE